jgi:hypothetical protein
VDRTDRPKRDAAILMHADLVHDPDDLPELVKRLDSGADMVVTRATLHGEPRRAARLVRKYAKWLLRGVKVSGIEDIVSGFGAFRLVSLRNAFRSREGKFLSADGWAANAELVARVAQEARRIETVDVVERHELRQRPSRIEPWALARELWREGGRLRIRGGRTPEDRKAPARGTSDQELEEMTR